jgi:hypothetical protein
MLCYYYFFLKNPASVLCPIGAGFEGPFLVFDPPPDVGRGACALGFDKPGLEDDDTGLALSLSCLLVAGAVESVSDPEQDSSV